MNYCLAEPKPLLVPVGPLQQIAAYDALRISVVLFCIFHTDTKLCKSITADGYFENDVLNGLNNLALNSFKR